MYSLAHKVYLQVWNSSWLLKYWNIPRPLTAALYCTRITFSWALIVKRADFTADNSCPPQNEMLMYCWPFEINLQGALSCKCKVPYVSAKIQKWMDLRKEDERCWLQVSSDILFLPRAAVVKRTLPENKGRCTATLLFFCTHFFHFFQTTQFILYSVGCN